MPARQTPPTFAVGSSSDDRDHRNTRYPGAAGGRPQERSDEQVAPVRQRDDVIDPTAGLETTAMFSR